MGASHVISSLPAASAASSSIAAREKLGYTLTVDGRHELSLDELLLDGGDACVGVRACGQRHS